MSLLHEVGQSSYKNAINKIAKKVDENDVKLNMCTPVKVIRGISCSNSGGYLPAGEQTELTLRVDPELDNSEYDTIVFMQSLNLTKCVGIVLLSWDIQKSLYETDNLTHVALTLYNASETSVKLELSASFDVLVIKRSE